MPLLRRVVPLALIAALVAPAVAAGASERPPSEAATATAGTAAGIDEVTLEGHGYGHGNGMGQYGALGYAVDHGWTYDRIVAHFYGGTTAGTVPDDDITVRLTINDGLPLVVRSDTAFSVGAVHVPAGGAARIERTGTSSFTVATAAAGPSSCSGPWEGQVTVQGTVVEAVPSQPPAASSSDLTRMLAMCRGSEQRWYRGALRLVSVDGTSRTVNRLPLDAYVQGVVPRESIPSWSSLGGGRGMEALKAQAVAARSYALGENRYSYARTCDSTSCQMYLGVAVKYGTGSVSSLEHASTNTATIETAGEVRRTAGGAVARTEFSTSSGGWTNGTGDGSAFPAVPDEGDDTTYNPYHSWTVTIAASTIEAHWPAVGDLEAVAVTERTGEGPWGGRVREVQLRGTGGTVTLDCNGWSACPFRSVLALKSTLFNVVGAEPPDPSPVVAMDAADSGQGYWLLERDGSVIGAGAVTVSGTTEQYGVRNAGFAQRPGGTGYWVLSDDGGVFAFGGAPFYGAGTGTSAAPFMAIAAHPDGTGYWLVRSNGKVQAFSAGSYGGQGGTAADPVVDIDATEDGGGYWTVDDEGRVRAYGNANNFGSRNPTHPVTGIAQRPNGTGYWTVAASGDVFHFGGAPFLGEVARNSRVPVVDIVATPSGRGYWLVDEAGRLHPFGDAQEF